MSDANRSDSSGQGSDSPDSEPRGEAAVGPADGEGAAPDQPGSSARGGRRRAADARAGTGNRVWVEDAGGRRPFMRGIMVHALTARGVPFDEAYATADRVRARLRGRGTVDRAELAKLVIEMLGDLSEAPNPVPTPILVEDDRRTAPFSKGTLAQSLLAAALEPNEAFDVAREIEADLVREGRATIARDELRERTNDVLSARFGDRVARRYRVWRNHQDPDKPVIVLLGGTTGVGKTSIALEVARRLGIRRVLSTDAIRQVMRITLTPELAPALHASSFDAYRHLPQPGDVIDGFDAQVQIVSVGVRAMIDRAIEEQTSLVLDGVSMVPGLLDLDAYRDRADVIFMLVARLDEQAFRSHFESRGRAQQLRGGRRYLENLESITEVQDHLLDLADRNDVPIIDNLSVDSSVLLVIRHVVESLGGPASPSDSSAPARGSENSP